MGWVGSAIDNVFARATQTPHARQRQPLVVFGLLTAVVALVVSPPAEAQVPDEPASLTPPGLVCTKLLGGNDDENPWDAAIGPDGSVYVTGTTISRDFPITDGAYSNSDDFSGTYVTKLDPTCSRIAYSARVGGKYHDDGAGIAVGPDGSAYVVGNTVSPDFPTTSGAFRENRQSAPHSLDAFLFKLDPSGSRLVYSTYLGGNTDDHALRVAVDEEGRAYVTGFTSSPDFPVTPGAFDTTYPEGFDTSTMFVTKFNAAGSRLAYSTFLGGSDYSVPGGIAVDSNGHAFVAGGGTVPRTPETLSLPQGGNVDAFVTKFSVDGSALVYSAQFGGSSGDGIRRIRLGSDGTAYVSGDTYSTDYPTTAGAFQTSLAGESDAFVTALDATGTSLSFSTLFGGSGGESNEIGLDASGNVYLGGNTNSTDLPTTPGADSTFGGDLDAYLARFAPDGSLTYATYIGDERYESVVAMAVDPVGVTYLVGAQLLRNNSTRASAEFQARSAALGSDQDMLVRAFVPACTVEGTSGDDELKGTPGRDVICAGSGADVVNAGGGNDIVVAADGNDTLYGGRGADVLLASGGANLIFGGAGSDRIAGGSGADRLYGGAGWDTIRSGDGSDVLEGGGNADRLYSGGGKDTLRGGSGNDALAGGAGDDRLYGNAGADRLSGGRGLDLCRGGVGADRMRSCER